MEEIKHKAQLSISRPNFGDGRELIEVRIKDVTAGVTFVELQISLADFSGCLTGLSNVDCEMELRGTQNVGRKILRDTLTIELPEGSKYRDKAAAIKAGEECCPDGWVFDRYFASQNTFYEQDGKSYAQTPMRSWVDKEQAK